MNTATHPGLKLYRPCRVGQTVKVNTKSKYKTGAVGQVVEVSNDITGWQFVAVNINGKIVDYRRCEVTPIKPA